jgi:hypothetical protein
MAELARLEDLSTEPPAGPTVMRNAHDDAMRKGVARLKSHLKDPGEAKDLLRVLMLTYLQEWSSMYAEGTRQLGLNSTERTILVIRQDTIQQLVSELGRTQD